MLIIDLMYELVVQSALFSVYFSMIVFALGLTTFFVVVPRLFARHIVIRVRNDYRLTQRRFELPQVMRQVFIVWFVRVFKRSNVVQDVDEDSFSLSFTKCFTIRGGERWKNTYSQMDGNLLY